MIYFDSAASTSPRQEVLDCFSSSNRLYFANPSSSHGLGRAGDRELSKARNGMLEAFGLSKTHQALFCSGATEANNLAIKGIAFSYQNRGKKILISSVEHPSVTETAQFLAERFGFEVVLLPVNEKGVVEPKTLESAMDKDVILVSIMGVNNETGSINDLSVLSQIVHRFPKAYFHSDLTQAIGKVDIPFAALDLFSFSGHKLHGLKGSGALIYKNSIRFVPVLHGGGQEFGFRSGTVSVPMADSLVLAVQLSLTEQKKNLAHVQALWDEIDQGMDEEFVRKNSYRDGSPYVYDFSLKKHKASVIVEALSQREIYVSSASACSSRTDKSSPVLKAMGRNDGEASNGVRVSFSEANTLEEVRIFLQTIHQLFKEVHVR